MRYELERVDTVTQMVCVRVCGGQRIIAERDRQSAMRRSSTRSGGEREQPVSTRDHWIELVEDAEPALKRDHGVLQLHEVRVADNRASESDEQRSMAAARVRTRHVDAVDGDADCPAHSVAHGAHSADHGRRAAHGRSLLVAIELGCAQRSIAQKSRRQRCHRASERVAHA
eukprot:CAMPEP_0119399596 /NCGR_PEP_ID=MMETSP1334-20130426/141441_1 /TAXON_ID=127549 /ORGANISM="Calcidiscus leptoporus, Strain RCC1130" /LENGTH=170 /DNA_ID=CAMNT_0007423491 /DNA_START=340 /DNA_END=852 /DNA_ORIENTATION=-